MKALIGFPPQARTGRGFTLIEILISVAIVALLGAILLPILAVARRSAYGSVCYSNLRQQHLALVHYLGDYDEMFPPIHLCWGVDGTFAITWDRDHEEAAERAHPRSYPQLFKPYLDDTEALHCRADIGLEFPQDIEQDSKKSYLAIPCQHSVPSADRTGVPMFERFGTSYRPAVELGGFQLADVPDPPRIFWAADAAGYWHTKYWRPAGRAKVAFDDDARWQTNTVFLDGHIRTTAFEPDVWPVYTEFIHRQRAL